MITLAFNEQQESVLQAALELYARLQMGQFDFFDMGLVHRTYDRAKVDAIMRKARAAARQ